MRHWKWCRWSHCRLGPWIIRAQLKFGLPVWTLLPPATKLGQGYVFTLVCHSVYRGVTVSVPRDLHPRGVSVPGRSLSGGVSVPGGSIGGLCPGGGLCWGVLSQKVSVQGVSVWGSLSGGLCPGGSLSGGVSVQGSLSRGSLSGGLCPGGSLSRGSLSWRSLNKVKSGRNASYWNAFLFKYSSFVCSISPGFFQVKNQFNNIIAFNYMKKMWIWNILVDNDSPDPPHSATCFIP